jgi:TM2 domain-containing membrane protein YozV
MLDLLQDESVERVAGAQFSTSGNDLALLVFTGRRVLLYHLNWNRVEKIEQIPFEAIMQVKPTSVRKFEVAQSIQVTLVTAGKKQDLKLYCQRADFLLLLAAEFSNRIGKTSGLSRAELCLTCLQPLQGDYCSRCATKLAADRQAMWLSILFPGLGQLRNGELQKGLVFAVLTIIFLLIGYIGIRGWFFEGADLTLKQKWNIGILVATAPIWYIANIYDAYHSSIRGRKPQ